MRIAEELGVDADVVLYIKEPPTAEDLHEIIAKLEDEPTALVRRDSKWKKLGLTDADAATEDQIVKSGKTFGWIVAFAAMCIAPLLAKTGSIFGYLQKMNAIYFIPIFSVVIVGMLNPRVPGKAAFSALILGLVLLLSKYFIPGVEPAFDKLFHNFHFLGIVFVILVAFMWIWGAIAPRESEWKLEANTPIDLTPWKGAKWASLGLLIIVVAMYASFADFG